MVTALQQRDADARRALAALEAQAETVRVELADLRLELSTLHLQISAATPPRLSQANEQLMLAALRADRIAQAAVSNLGELVGAVVLRPSQLKEANQELVLAALAAKELEVQAEAAHQRQIRFLATVAHELRNPLSPIRTAAGMLGRVGSDEAMLQRIQGIIERQVVRMSRLVEDLLDGAAAGSGQFRIERVPTDLGEVLASAVEACRPAIDARSHALQVRVPPLPIPVSGDALRLTQVFCNLLDNACKYTPEGGDIGLHAERGSTTVSVRVSDNGMGISPDALPHVFDLFVQETRARQVSRSGLGVGLAVVRSLLEAHGGSIVASSAGLELGSEFLVTLPLFADCQPD